MFIMSVEEETLRELTLQFTQRFIKLLSTCNILHIRGNESPQEWLYRMQ